MTQQQPSNDGARINLNIPAPDQPLSYADGESYKYRSLLEGNGIALTDDALIAALRHPISALGAAAAHELGDRNVHAAIPALTRALASSDDLLEVEAAYALARMGEASGNDTLVACLGRQLDAYVSPPIAAGYLARIGNAHGFWVVNRAFDVETARLLACKQLFFFVPFQGETLDDGQRVDVFPLYARALSAGDVYVQSQALAQLRELRPPDARPALEAYVASDASDDVLRRDAQTILDVLPAS
jgi:HEAT repeat protein